MLPEPPERIEYSLEEALDLLTALEDAGLALSASDHLAVLAELEYEVAVLQRKLGFDG
ncbi:MAG TPA: hypothetical protein VNF50_02680 [Acidimicrobiales bacterium]|nr:hypothetical protein [Acidimicrobiales bacterium]